LQVGLFHPVARVGLHRVTHTGLPKPDATEVAYPELLHPEYHRRLKAATAGSNIVGAHADVPTVCIPTNNALTLTVSFRPTPPSAGPIHQPAGQPQSTVVVSESAPVPLVIQWLMEAAEMQDGYTVFKQGQHHVQTNVDIVASWWFAVSFSERYSRTVSPVQPMQAHGHK
jgi:hypothetical protein